MHRGIAQGHKGGDGSARERDDRRREVLSIGLRKEVWDEACLWVCPCVEYGSE